MLPDWKRNRTDYEGLRALIMGLWVDLNLGARVCSYVSGNLFMKKKINWLEKKKKRTIKLSHIITLGKKLFLFSFVLLIFVNMLQNVRDEENFKYHKSTMRLNLQRWKIQMKRSEWQKN